MALTDERQAVYDDEHREDGALQALRFEELLSDRSALLALLEDRGHHPAMSSTPDESAQQLARLRRENAELTKRLGSANAALDAYRAETRRLKGDLKRLRTSRSYRVGRALGNPLRLVPSAPGGAPSERPDRSPRSASESGADVRRPSELTYEELLTRFTAAPDAERLGHVLSRGWYERGLATDLAGLLAAHPEVAESLAGHERVLAERVMGVARVLTRGVDVPARAEGAAYLPEPGRIMYCAHSTPAYNTNGYSVRTRGLADGLRASGSDVVVVGRAGYPWDVKSDSPPATTTRHVVPVDGVDFVHLPGSPLPRTALDRWILECADAFVREARRLRPEVIHAASNHQVGLAALIAARRLGVPFVYEVRGLWEVTEASAKPGWEGTERYRLQADLETLVASEADHVLAITSQTADELARRGVDPERISLLPNGVDTDEQLPLPKDAAFASRHGIRTDVPVIGFAGSLVPYEGLDVLVDAVALLRDRGVDTQLVVAGSGSAETELARRVRDLGLQDSVRLLGRLPAADMPRLLSLFDVMPCPRLSLPVTQMVSPLKPLEAMATGKAVVLSDVAPHLDLAGADGERAVLVPAGEAEALADALERLVDDADARADLGRSGRMWCLAERTWVQLADTLRDGHRAATRRHAALVEGGRELADLRVGIVADEFTTATLSSTCEVVPLDRSGWREQLDGLDLVFLESAWNGNDGSWHRAVGQYSDEEHADVRALLDRARELGIPSVFWNKEDPIHFARFLGTASLCDHVFTTDADTIPGYLSAGEGVVRTVSSLPFHAQPRIHNPLPGQRPWEATVAYAGTYYGERYPQRSAELERILEAARPFGLAIYDRQAAIPDSPYHFPASLAPFVRGSLPYDEVIDSYKAHVAHLNVNSVAGSPTMFSRRVVEVAACGGVVLSGPGRGIEETLGSTIPTTDDPLTIRALLRHWSEDPDARRREAWLQMRTVLRSHTVGAALVLVARTAGIPVDGPRRPRWVAVVDDPSDAVHASLDAQSVPPAGVVGSSELGDVDAEWVARVTEPLPRTWAEDLLHALEWGDWDRVEPCYDDTITPGLPLAEPGEGTLSSAGLVSLRAVRERGDLAGALTEATRPLLVRPPWGRGADERNARRAVPASRSDVVPTGRREAALSGLRVLVAGHDLKFARSLLATLRDRGAVVEEDRWASHADHDADRSLALLADADVVLCEWGLGNAEWYSRHVRPDQRLVVRVHAQELRRRHLARIRHDAVHTYVFVSEHIRRSAVLGHGIPAARAVVVPNPVDVDALSLPKDTDALRTLGLVGVVPALKRLDLALDVLEGLHARGLDHRLRIKGRIAADYPWMRDRPDEMRYYDAQDERISRINAARPGSVLLDGHGDDMAQWYRKVGVVLSVSDHESFHLTIADGAASGALPAVLAWPGSDLVYPREWLSATVPALVERIATTEPEPDVLRAIARERFDAPRVLERLVAVLTGDRGE
jgi:glycosyltransferase involved in cell wall biosynthesis/spore maturation protein CgeB